MKTRIITLLATSAALLLGSALTLSAADKPAGQCAMSGMSCPMSGKSGMSCPMSGGMSGMSAMSGCCAGAMSATATADIPANYPLKTCVVSGRELGKMGAPYVYTYKQAGQPDRTVLLCCKMCVAAFEKDPAKYLAVLDAAAKK